MYFGDTSVISISESGHQSVEFLHKVLEKYNCDSFFNKAIRFSLCTSNDMFKCTFIVYIQIWYNKNRFCRLNTPINFCLFTWSIFYSIEIWYSRRNSHTLFAYLKPSSLIRNILNSLLLTN